MLSGISYYHFQWPVGSGGCSASEYIGMVPPQKHVLGIWPQRLGGGHAVSAGCPTGPQGVYADMLFLSVNRRVLSLPFLELGQILLAAPGLSTVGPIWEESRVPESSPGLLEFGERRSQFIPAMVEHSL